MTCFNDLPVELKDKIYKIYKKNWINDKIKKMEEIWRPFEVELHGEDEYGEDPNDWFYSVFFKGSFVNIYYFDNAWVSSVYYCSNNLDEIYKEGLNFD